MEGNSAAPATSGAPAAARRMIRRLMLMGSHSSWQTTTGLATPAARDGGDPWGCCSSFVGPPSRRGATIVMLPTRTQGAIEERGLETGLRRSIQWRNVVG